MPNDGIQPTRIEAATDDAGRYAPIDK